MKKNVKVKFSFRGLIRQIESFFWVETKDGKVLPFTLNVIQNNFVDKIVNLRKDYPKKPLRVIILKGRQFGFSTLILAWFFVKCILIDNTRAVVIAHDQETTKKLFRRVRFFAKTFKIPPRLDKESEREYSFPDTNSYFYIGTAGSRVFGRGDNLTDVHCSEVAFWPNAAEIMNGLLQAVGMTGNVIIETTANGVGNYFNRLWKRSYNDSSAAWTALFFKWTLFPEYEMDVPGGFKRTEAEEHLCKIHLELNDKKLQWRRWKISETEPAAGFTAEQIFMQEYPFTPREAFISSGKSIFSLSALEAYDPEPSVDEEDGWLIWDSPSGYSVMGIDVAEGLENQDRSVIDIYNEYLEQVAHWAGWCDTDELAEKAIIMGLRYNSYVVCEINSMGVATMNVLKKKYHSRGFIYKREDFDKTSKQKIQRYGWRSTRITKGVMVADLSTAIREHQIKLNNPDTIDECMSFVKDGKGGMAADEGANDDRVIAAGLALQGFLDRPPSKLVLDKKLKADTERESKNRRWRANKRKQTKKRKKLLKYG